MKVTTVTIITGALLYAYNIFMFFAKMIELICNKHVIIEIL